MKRYVVIGTLYELSVKSIEAFLNSQHTDMRTVSVQLFPERQKENIIAIFESNK